MKIVESWMCIGGPADGKRHQLPESATRLVIAGIAGSPFIDETSPSHSVEVPVAHHCYRKEHFKIGDILVGMWIEEHLSNLDAFKLLLENYRPKQEGNS